MMKKFYLFLVLCCLQLAAFGQTTVTIYADSATSKSRSVKAYASAALSLQNDSIVVRDQRGSGTTSNFLEHGYCVFDLASAGIPAGATVTAVTLGYYVNTYLAGSLTSTNYHINGVVGDLSSNSNVDVLNGILKHDKISTSNTLLINNTGFGTATGNQTLALTRASGLSWIGNNAGGKISIIFTERSSVATATRRYAIMGYTGNRTSTTTNFHRPFITVTYTAPSSCSGTPTAGTTIATPQAGNAATYHILSLSGASATAGLTYQWQSSSTEGGTYTNISGATQRTYSYSNVTATTYYRCAVTCSSSTTYSAPTPVFLINAYTCTTPVYTNYYYTNYVVSTTYPMGGMTINCTFTGDSSTSLQDSITGSPRSYNNNCNVPGQQGLIFYKGFTHSLTVRGAQYGQNWNCWIDYNNNGTFETTELRGGVDFGTGAGMVSTLTLAAVPSSIATGYYRMRVVGVYSTTNPISCPTAYSYGNTRDFLVKITNPPPAATATPTSLAFGYITTGTSSHTLSSAVAGSYLVPASGSVTVTAPSLFEVSPDGSTWASSFTASYTTSTYAGTVYARFNPTAAVTTIDTIRVTGGGLATALKIVVTGTGATPCTGTPTAGTAAVSPTTGSSGTTFNLSLSGTTTTGGLTYQWQSSSTGTAGTWSNISGATNMTYSFSGMTANTYYRCMVTCSFSAATDSSSSVMATWVLPTSSCTPTVTDGTSTCSTYQMVFTKVRMTGAPGYGFLGDSASCSTSGYQSRTTLGTTLFKSYTYTMNMSTGTTYSISTQWWIDFNSNGAFETSETVGGNATQFTGSGTCALTIPSTVPSGVYRMRGYSCYYYGTYSPPSYVNYPNFNPCGGHYYGEARDYTVTIMNPPPYGTNSRNLNFGTIAVGATSSADTSRIVGLFLTPASGSVTITAPSNYEVSSTGTSWSSSYTAAYTSGSLTSRLVYVRFNPTAVATYTDTVRISGGGMATDIKIPVTGIGAYPCTGAPTTGTLLASDSSGYSTTSFTFSLSGASLGLGLVYQWQSSATGTAGTFTNISGATNTTYTVSGLTGGVYYRVVLTCSYSGLSATSASRYIKIFCRPTVTYGAYSCTSYGMVINALNLTGYSGTISDALSCDGTAFRDRTALSCTLRAGDTYSPTIGTSSSYSMYHQAWIDFNDNGVFDSLETIGYNSPAVYTSILATWNIPVTANVGTHRMRVMVDYSGDGRIPPGFNPCGTGHNYGEARDYTIVIAPPAPRALATPTSVSFGSVTSGTTSSALTTSLLGSYLVPASGSITITGPSSIFEVSPDGSTWSTSYTQSYSSSTYGAASVYVRFSPTSTITYNDTIRVTGGGLASAYNIPVTGIGAPLCTGTPTAGTASCTPTSGGTAVSFTHSLTGTTVSGGLTYQWYTASSYGGSYSAISGATNSTYTTSGITATTYYYCQVGCSVSGLSSNSTIDSAIWTIPPASCAAPTTTYAAYSCTSYQMTFLRVAVSGELGSSFNDVLACNSTGYRDRTSLSATLYKSYTYSFAITTGTSYTVSTQWWIDFNGDGTFQSTESVGGNSTLRSGAFTAAVTIPATVASGTYRMRGFTSYSSPVFPSISACGGHNYGEARDYTINITNPPPYMTLSTTTRDFGPVATSGCSSTLTSTLNGYFLSPSSGSVTITAPTNYQVFDGSAWTSSFNYSYTGGSISSYSVMMRLCPPGTSTYSGNVSIAGGSATTMNIAVTGYGATPCSGTPTAGTTTASDTFASGGATVALGLSGSATGLGLSYQWYSSATGTGGWSAITGATSASYNLTTTGTTTYYYCRVTCSYSSLFSYSSVVRIIGVCTPTYTSAATACTTYGMVFGRVTLVGSTGTLADSAACNGSGYVSRIGLSTSLWRGFNYTVTMVMGSASYGMTTQWWIDFNSDGTFQTTEAVGGNTTQFNGTGTATLSIPGGVSNGRYVMRGICGYYYGTYSPPSYVNYPNYSPCGGHYYGEARDYMINITDPPPAITTAPATLAFGGVLVSSASASQSFTFSGSYFTPASGSLTVTAPTNYEVSPDGSTWSSSYTVAYTGSTLSTTTGYARFTPPSATTFNDTVRITGGGLTAPGRITVTGTGAGACSATPTAGTAAVTPTSGSIATSFVLSLTGTTVAGGLTYQWASSSTGTAGSFTNISGATTPSYSFSGITANTYYKCYVTCPTYGTDSTASILATYVLPTACTPTVTSAGPTCTTYQMVFTKVRMTAASGFLGDSAACTTAGYQDRTSLSATLWRGYSYTMNMSTGASYGITSQWWIDFNSNGTFETTEAVGGNTTQFTSSGSCSITIPGSVSPGIFRMRGYSCYYYGTYSPPSYVNYPNFNPCGGHYYGEARDYTIVITNPPPTVVVAPTSLAFGGVLTGSSSTAQTYTITGFYLLPASGSLTVTAPTDFQVSSDGSSWATSYTIGYTGSALSATTSYVRFNPSSATVYNDTVRVTGGGLSTATKLVVTGTGAGACSATPTAGTAAVTPTSGSTSTTFTLSLTGTTVASGLTYQWAVSTTGAAGSFTSIAGATTPMYVFTGISATRYYKCFVTCPTYGTDSTASVTATFVLPTACTPTFTYAANACTSYQMVFTKLRMTAVGGFLGDSAACNTSGYNDRTSLSATLYRGSSYTMNMSVGSSYSVSAQFWIDFNSDGTFQTTEDVGGQTTLFLTSSSCTITIPTGVTPGVYRMRGITSYSSPVYPSISPCGGHNYGGARDYTIVIATPPASVTATPSSLAFGGVLTGTSSSALTTSITGTWLTPASGSLTVTAPSFYEVSSDGSTWSSSYTIGYTGAALSATTVYARFNPASAIAYNDTIRITGGGLAVNARVPVTGTGAGACSATPTAGTAAITPTTGSTGTSFTLSLTGTTVASGLTFQWKSATAVGGPYTNIAGATTSTYGFTGLTATTYYKCFVTCPTYGTDSTTAVSATYVLPASSCTPSTTNASYACTSYSMVFTRIRMVGVGGTLADSAACSTSGYNDRTVLSTTLYRGSTYTMNMSTGVSYGIGTQWWIDFNNDGTFQSTEAVGGNSTTFTTSGTCTITIPSTVSAGAFRMRGFTSYSSPVYPSINPCGGHTYGEARDYTIIIATPPAVLTATPSSLAFGGVLTGTSSSALTTAIVGTYLVPTSGSLTVTAPSNFEVSSTGSSWSSSYTIGYTGGTLSSTTVYVRFNPSSAIAYADTVRISGGSLSPVTRIPVTGTGASACSGTPTAGTAAITPTTGSTGTSFTLSLTGTTAASGLTFQWKSSSTGAAGSYTNISGATTSTYGFTGISTNRYYKCFVTCPTFGTDSSNAVLATYVLPASSCATPVSTNGALSCSSYQMILTKVRIPSAASGFFGDSAACNTVNGYNDRTSLSLTLYSGSSYTVNMSTGASYGITSQWWIDFNNNGTFETSESVGGSSTTFISTGTTTIAVPSGSATGSFRMRVMTAYSSGLYPSTPPCGGHTYGGARDYTVVIATPPPSISTTPSTLSFGSVTVGSTSSSINYVITADNMVPSSGSLTLTAPTGYQISADGTTGWASSYTVAYSGGSLSAAAFARFSPSSATTYNDTIRITGGGLSPEGKVAVTGTGATACSGTPTAGTATITPSTGTTTTSFTLNLTGSTSAGGLTYQWQMSDYGTAGTYSNIPGATTIAYTFTGIPNNRYFQCIVRCGTDSATSAATMATYVLPSASCTPSFSSAALSCTSYFMTFLSMNLTGAVGSISDALACNSTGYRDRTSLFCGLVTGSSYTATVQTGATYATAVQFWIDFNNDGVFQSSEAVGGTTTAVTGTYTATLTIPGGVSAGVFRMRAVMNYGAAVYPSINPCGGVAYGEGRDYTVIIITPTACTGTPTAGATTSSATTGCAPLASTLNITGSAGVTGLTYQWLSSTTGAFGSWSAISGATASSYSATTTSNTYYRCRIVCTGSGGVDTSSAVYVTPTTAPGSITGGTFVCSGGADTLFNATSGGTWSSSATGVATINPTTGRLTGSSIGTCTISYTVAGCSPVTLSYSVNGSPASITGFTSLCVGGSSSLASATVGGTWSSANSAIATVDPSTGVTTGMSAGTTTISYSNGCGTPATTSWTTNVTPTAIVGPTSICTLSTGTFTDTITGGTWSNTPTTFGTINSSTGLFTATATTGTSTLTYTIGFCSVTGTAVVGAISPDTLVGASAVCRSGSTTFTCATSGGVWSSSDAGIATVHPTSGVVTGVSSGTASISYSTGCGTPSTRSITVNGSPVTITASTTCSQGNLTLTASVGAGSYTYSWSGPLGFTSTAASPVISSASTGRSGIYSVTATQSGCASSTSFWVSVDTTAQVSVNASPASICPGFTSTVTNAVSSPAIGSYVLNAIPYAPVTLTSSTAGPTGTNANTTVTMPFGFNLYGTTYSTVYISTNGYINFGAAATANSSVALPNSAGTTPKAMIAPFWHYMNASTGTIYYTTLGVSPNRRFVVQYNGVADFSGGGTNTAQVVLYETSNVIDMFISQKSSATYAAVCGIQDASGTSALTVPGQNSATYTINNTTAGTGWRFSRPNYSYAWSPATGLSSTTATAPVATLTSTTTYTVNTVDANSGCTTGANAPVTVNVFTPANVYTVTPDSGCTAGTTVGLSGSQAGFTYNLFRSATNVGTLTGTGSALSFGSMTTAGAYRVVATTTDGCNANMSDTTIVFSNPTAYSVTGGNGCTTTGVVIGLSNSQSGVSYELVRDGSTVVATVSGTGAAISFGSRTVAGTYTVRGTYTTGGACQTNMSGSSVISTNPSAYTLTGGSAGCSSSGLTLGLSSSDTGVNYQLYRGASTVGSPLSGTGSAISFGLQTTAGTYTIVATGAGGCQTNMTGSAVITTSPSVTLGANPVVCQPLSSTNLSYSGAVGTPTLYSITWDSTSLATGFSNVSSASLSGSIPLSIPSSVYGVFGGTITVANASCTSSSYTFSLTVYQHPTAAITSAVVPCSGYSTNIVFTGTPGASISYSVDGAAATSNVMTAGSYSLSTGALTGTHTYHLIEAFNAVCNDATVDTTISITANLMQWVGGTTGSESDWNTNANWGCGFYPTVNDDAIIPSGTTYAPVLSSASGTTRNLTIASGATLSIGSGLNVAVKGNMNNAGTVSGNGKIVLSGTSAQAIAGMGDVNALELNNTSGASISASSRVTVKKVLTITAGTLNTNDSLVLYSDTTGSARVAPIASGNISGNVKVMQYVPGGRRAYRFMAHPFSSAIALGQLSTGIDVTGQGGSTNGFTTTGSNAASAFRYNTLVSNSASSYDPGWKAFTSALTTSDTNGFARYQGIRIFLRGARGEGLSYATYTPSPTTMTTMGALNQGTQTVTLAKGGAANQEYNMVGNPYASPVDIGTVAYDAKVSGNIVGAAIYVWNPYLATVGQFQAIPVNTTSATPYYLQANASFQVRAGHNGDSLVFTESSKSANATATVIKGLPDYVSLFVYDAQYHAFDMLHIKFGAEATDNEDNDFDAAKPQGPDFNLYSISADDHKLAIDGRPYAAGKSIPLGINSNYNQEFIIKTEALSVPTGGRVFLHDKLLNQYVMLQQGTEYKFNVTKDAATQGDKRFELTMEPGVDATSNGLQVTMTPNPASNEVSISYTSGNAEHVTVKVSDLTGMNVFTKDMGVQQNGKVIVPITNLAAGIYMVELTSGSQKVVQRLIKE